MKQFVKALENDGDCFKYICLKFPGFIIEKLKTGIFDGPQIRKLMNDANFCNFINPAELSAWTAFTNVVKFFLGKTKAANCKGLVETLLTSLHQLGANTRSDMKVRYQSRWDATMLADYCWSIKRDSAGDSHSRKSVNRQFLVDDVYASHFLQLQALIVNILV